MKASDNPFPSLLLTEQASTPATPAAGQARLYRATDGSLYVVDDTGAVTAVGAGGGSPSGGGLVDFAKARRTSGNSWLDSTAWVNIDTVLDLTLAAQAGDEIEARMAVRIEAVGSGSRYCVMDFHTIVAGAPVNSVAMQGAASGTTGGHPGWATGTALTAAQGYTFFTGSKRYTLQAGDISGGTVTLRLRGRSGTGMTIAAADPHLYVEATNLGPMP